MWYDMPTPLGMSPNHNVYLPVPSMCMAVSPSSMYAPQASPIASSQSTMPPDSSPFGSPMPQLSLSESPAASGSSPIVPPSMSWSLAWCHERCHKPATEPLRKAIDQIVSAAGGRLSCLKKAKRFAAWLSAAPQRQWPFVLLTDWREVKPCLQAMSQMECPRPLMIVVLLDQPLHLDRVLGWARNLPMQGIRDRVHVIMDISELSVLLLDMVSRLRNAEALQSWAWANSGLGPRELVLPLPTYGAAEGLDALRAGFDTEPVRVVSHLA